MSLSRRFWLGYSAAWLPLFAVYFFAFSSQGQLGAGATAVAAAVNVLPDALLGVGALRVCRGLWRREDRARVGALVLAAGVAFTALATGVKSGASLAWVRLDSGAWTSLDRGVVLWQGFLSALAFAGLASLTFGAATAARLRAEEERRAAAEVLRARSELKALRAQLNPHFLFNTLHSLRALVRANPDAAEAALEQLGDLLRYALRAQDAEDDGVLLREEWEFVRAYLALEKLRLGARLRVEAEASDAALGSVVPVFVLQPLVENAVKHGIAPNPRGGTVWIRAALERGELRLEVRDDGPGASAASGTGRGLDVVRQRVRALYGGAGSLTIDPAQAGFAVTLRLPPSLEPA